MDDVQLYIYLALALIYFLSRAFKTKKPVNQGGGQPANPFGEEDIDPQSGRNRPISFEDLLKEFTREQEEQLDQKQEKTVRSDPYQDMSEEPETVTPQPEPEPEPQLTYDSYDDYRSPYQNYEDIYGSQENTTLDVQVSLDEPLKKRFDVYKIGQEEEGAPASHFRALLRDPDSIKDAIVLKEILDRKYF